MKNKNIGFFVMLCFAIVGWGTVWYQSKLQRDSEDRIRESIAQDLQERMAFEDSIKRDMERKKKDQEFIMQLDSQNELENRIETRLTGYESEYARHKEKLESDVKSELGTYKEQQIGFSGQLQAYQKQITQYEKELADTKSAFAVAVEENSKYTTDLENRLNRHHDDYQARMAAYETKLDALREELEACVAKQHDLETVVATLQQAGLTEALQ